MPLPLFFAEDKLSFYKVMSDTNGYKHIHYVKDVSVTSFLYAECVAQSYQSMCLDFSELLKEAL